MNNYSDHIHDNFGSFARTVDNSLVAFYDDVKDDISACVNDQQNLIPDPNFLYPGRFAMTLALYAVHEAWEELSSICTLDSLSSSKSLSIFEALKSMSSLPIQTARLATLSTQFLVYEALSIPRAHEQNRMIDSDKFMSNLTHLSVEGGLLESQFRLFMRSICGLNSGGIPQLYIRQKYRRDTYKLAIADLYCCIDNVGVLDQAFRLISNSIEDLAFDVSLSAYSSLLSSPTCSAEYCELHRYYNERQFK